MNLNTMRKDYDIYKMLYDSTFFYVNNTLLSAIREMQKFENSIKATYVTKAIQAAINRNHVKVFNPEICMWGKIFIDPMRLHGSIDGKYDVLKSKFWRKSEGYYCASYIIWYENGSIENIRLESKKQNIATVINSSMKYVFFRDSTLRCYNYGFKLSKWSYPKEITQEFIEKVEEDKFAFSKIKKPKKRKTPLTTLTDKTLYANHIANQTNCDVNIRERISTPLRSFLNFVINEKNDDYRFSQIRTKKTLITMITSLVKALSENDNTLMNKDLFCKLYGHLIVDIAILRQVIAQQITRESIIKDVKGCNKHPDKNHTIMLDVMNKSSTFINRFYDFMCADKSTREDIAFILLESINNLIFILNHIHDKEYEDIKKIMLNKEVFCFKDPEDSRKFNDMLIKLYNEIVSIT